jgi:hypothetical protein
MGHAVFRKTTPAQTAFAIGLRFDVIDRHIGLAIRLVRPLREVYILVGLLMVVRVLAIVVVVKIISSPVAVKT